MFCSVFFGVLLGKKNVIIAGAAGRDFHNFLAYYKKHRFFKVVAFTAAQIPGIANRKFPASLAGKKYPKGIPPVETDPKLLRIVFQNLLSNAVGYTPSEGKISIEIKKYESGVVIEVSDSGSGIPPDAQSKIFTKFFRADNAQTIKPDGTGLGLYIVKAIVGTLGGTISFQSKEKEGTVFLVTMPGRGVPKREAEKKLN